MKWKRVILVLKIPLGVFLDHFIEAEFSKKKMISWKWDSFFSSSRRGVTALNFPCAVSHWQGEKGSCNL